MRLHKTIQRRMLTQKEEGHHLGEGKLRHIRPKKGSLRSALHRHRQCLALQNTGILVHSGRSIAPHGIG